MFRAPFLIVLCVIVIEFLQSEEMTFYSQCGQDKYLYENVFSDKKNGVFVDIGANDGISLSNTYFFEKNRGWTGICVEPNLDVFKLLQTNRTCTCVQGCVSDKNGTVQFLQVKDLSGHRLDMLSGIMDKYDSRHLDRVRREVASVKGSSMEVLPIRCYTLNQLLLDHNIHHVDYLSIDTEGGEVDILKAIDFSLCDIDIINVENNFNSPEFSKVMEDLGYQKIATLEQDEFYRKKIGKVL